jgi:hypothetical protein
MTWELYEVWTEDEDGHEELVDTTQSLKEAKDIAKTALVDYPIAVIYKETEDGDIVEFERLTS